MILIKYLLIFFLGLWLIRSILRGLLGGLFGQAQQRSFHQQQTRSQSQRRTGDIHVDHNPQRSRKNKTSDGYKGGDYIDYEEVD